MGTRRRDIIALVGGVVAWPFAARAQQANTPVVGFLDSGSSTGMAETLAAFHRGLAESGYTEGQNVAMEYRWAEGRYDRLPALAAELVARPVAVIVATRSSAPARAARAATSNIPIVFQTGSDPVKDGLVESLNRPGGNVTGATRLTTALVQKRLGVMAELVPKMATIALLTNPAGPQTTEQVAEMEAAVRARGLKLHVAKASSDGELDGAFEALVQARADALIIGSDNLFIGQRKHIVELTMRHAIPTIFFERDSVVDGGLMTYSASLAESFRQVGSYAGLILKGTRPADLPVLQPTKFDLVINLKTARRLGIVVPAMLLATADEVME
ncbi:MAG TPA: ABC transporter substrate-binding protein [Bradyrhizobium sp.]|nr:ABC transporter substrate-binding protein [Bradyrhizobium sp.]